MAAKALSMFSTLSNAAGDVGAAVSSGAGDGIAKNIEKEICAILREDKSDITESAIKAIDDEIKQKSTEILQPIVDTVKEIVKSEVEKQLAEEKDKQKSDGTKSNEDAVEERASAPGTSPEKASGPAETTEENPAETTEEKPVETTEEKPVETTEEKPATTEEKPATTEEKTESPKTDIAEKADEMKDKALALATDKANEVKDKALDLANEKSKELKDKAMSELSNKFGNLGNISSMASKLVKGGTKKLKNKRRLTKKKAIYGPRCKTLYYKNGGKRKTRRSRRK